MSKDKQYLVRLDRTRYQKGKIGISKLAPMNAIWLKPLEKPSFSVVDKWKEVKMRRKLRGDYMSPVVPEFKNPTTPYHPEAELLDYLFDIYTKKNQVHPYLFPISVYTSGPSKYMVSNAINVEFAIKNVGLYAYVRVVITADDVRALFPVYVLDDGTKTATYYGRMTAWMYHRLGSIWNERAYYKWFTYIKNHYQGVDFNRLFRMDTTRNVPCLTNPRLYAEVANQDKHTVNKAELELFLNNLDVTDYHQTALGGITDEEFSVLQYSDDDDLGPT